MQQKVLPCTEGARACTGQAVRSAAGRAAGRRQRGVGSWSVVVVIGLHEGWLCGWIEQGFEGSDPGMADESNR